MDSGYFLFALFVFGLVCVAIVFAWILFSSSRGRNKRVTEREKQLLKMHRDIDDMVSTFKREAEQRLSDLYNFSEISDKLFEDMREIAAAEERIEPLRNLSEISGIYSGELRVLTEASRKGIESLRGLIIASDERIEALRRLIELADDRRDAVQSAADSIRLVIDAAETRVETLRAAVSDKKDSEDVKNTEST